MAARGIARYLRCLLDELASAFPDDRYEVVDPGRPALALAAVAGRPRLDRTAPECEVVWMPAPAPVAVSPGTPYVLSVHDLSFEHRPGDYSRYDRLWHRLARPARLARDARLVLCSSEATRRAALAEWRLDPERTRTVRLGPGRRTRATAGVPAGLPESFFLAVGALEARKQPDVLAEGHARAREQGLRAGLVFAGDGPLRGRLERAGATVLGHVNDDALDALYERALALACISRDEGFGFTPLEALAHKTPSIVSDLPVFDETLGDGALRVPPGDPVAVAAALLRVEQEPDLRTELAVVGARAAARLSWAETARETRAALAEASA